VTTDLLGIVDHLFQGLSKGSVTVDPGNCSRVLHVLDVVLHKDKLLSSEAIQKRFLDCVALVYGSLPADYLLNSDLRIKMCKLACRCVVQFCQLDKGMNGAEKGNGESVVAVSCCAKVWEALLSLSLGALGSGNVDGFHYCLQNIHFVFNNTTSDPVRKVFAGLLLRAVQEMDKCVSSAEKTQLLKANMASCGLSFAVSFVEKVKGKNLDKSCTDANAVAATLCISIGQQISKVDFSHERVGSGTGPATICGFDLTSSLFEDFLSVTANPKIQHLLLQVWNQDVTKSVAAAPEKDWLSSFVTYFAPGIAKLTAHAIAADQDAYLNVAVEGLKFYGLCLQAFAGAEEKAAAISALALPLLYSALTSASGSRTAKTIAQAANKIFNLFASKSPASAKAFIQGLPNDKRLLLTKGLQESNVAAPAAQAANSARAGRGRFNPGRIKKPTIALKSFGAKS